MDAHGKGMEACQNGEACRPCPRCCWDICHTTGRTFNPVLGLSSSQHQHPSELGKRTIGNPVRLLKCIHGGYINMLTQFRWLYSLILAEDANFKQKARAHSNTNKDPPLGPGWGTFVENEAYLQHISTAPNKTEVFPCSYVVKCQS
jgi:hypothetical protein